MDPREKIVYQIWPRSFCDGNGDGVGDLGGVIAKLDYLHELGVDLLWLSPVYASPNRDYGYDVSDYYAINPEYGTLAEFDRLVAEAKARGIGILMDFVPNHTSDQHAWFQAALNDPNSSYRDFYYFRPGKNGGAPNNWMSFFGGSAWTQDKKTGEYYLTSFTPGQCDLNWENPAVRQEMYKAMRFWMDRGIAGFRIDVVNAIKKAPGLPDKDPHKRGLQFPAELVTKQEGVHTFIQEMHREVFSHYPDCFTVGEGCLTGIEDVARFTNPENRELMMMFHFDIAMLGCGPLGKFDFRKGYRFTIRDFKRVVNRWQLAMQEKNGWTGNYLSNHDQPRQVSRFGSEKTPELRRASARALALLNLTLRGTPFLYQGEECGMTNCRLAKEEWKDFEAINDYAVLQSMMRLPAPLAEKIIVKMTRDNARTPVQWSGGRNAGFTDGTPWMRVNPNYREINIEEDVLRMDSVVNFYKKAIALHHAHPALTFGTYAPVDEKNKRVLAYLRRGETETLLVAINLSDRQTKVSFPRLNARECLLYTHSSRTFAQELPLLPFEGLVYKVN
ncbi:MAG: alpha-glucosidase [Christensenella sp.]|jgi:oligo-1,6-glucosidase|nr:alpha-glucosidase [Christensenella sp.]